MQAVTDRFVTLICKLTLKVIKDDPEFFKDRFGTIPNLINSLANYNEKVQSHPDIDTTIAKLKEVLS